MSDLVLSPIVPLFVITVLALAGTVICIVSAFRAPVAGALRFFALFAIIALLANPQIREEDIEALPNIVLAIVDESESQKLDNRDTVSAETFELLESQLSGFSNLEVRRLSVQGRDETKLGETLSLGLSEIPHTQRAGIFVISDGLASDVESETLQASLLAPFRTPVHLLLTGRKNETDRVLEIVKAPRYGIVNESVEIIFRINDTGTKSRLTNITLRVNGQQIANRAVQVGQDIPLSARLDTPGKAIIELIASPVDGELTTRNNRAVVEVSVIRDRLRVLLVSGEPHPGERVWRNLLKSDPAVDLVHFTILKPSTKALIGTQDELALIEFPQNELFLEKLDKFDVLIFDRYTYRNVMTPLHFDNISRYVQDGGAILISSGPEFTGQGSIAARRNLAYILPVLPTGEINETAFIPRRSDIGNRHPVTAELPDETEWGRWMRSLTAFKRSGDTLIERESGEPILVVDRVGEGRVALLMSDHVWLWAKNFDGGGPHRELLRRLVHWLMKEPELEEEALELRASADQKQMTILRRTLSGTPMPVTIEAPDGKQSILDLTEGESGSWTAKFTPTEPGLYSATSETQSGRTVYDVEAFGLATPPEFQDVVSTSSRFENLLETTGGTSFSVRKNNRVTVPSIRLVREERATTGRNVDSGWMGIVDRNASRIDNVTVQELLPRSVWLLLIAALILIAWLTESGRLAVFTKRR